MAPDRMRQVKRPRSRRSGVGTPFNQLRPTQPERQGSCRASRSSSRRGRTKKQPGHQPENWRAPQVEETAHGGVGISSGTSDRCSCRNFGTCIITLVFSSGPVRRDGSFWDFGSLYHKASRRRTASCCGSGKPCRRRHCGVPAAVCCGSGRI